MPEMFFFENEPSWRQNVEALGIQRVIDHLKAEGSPHEWPLMVANPEDKFTFFHPFGRGFRCYESPCPCYEGYYLDGLAGAVKCKGCPDLLPGVVCDTICKKEFTTCPYYKEHNNG